MNINELIDGAIQPTNSIGTCPACGHNRFTHEYCEQSELKEIQTRSGAEWLDSTTHGSGRSPHLHITCSRCKFEWIEHPAWV